MSLGSAASRSQVSGSLLHGICRAVLSLASGLTVASECMSGPARTGSDATVRHTFSHARSAQDIFACFPRKPCGLLIWRSVPTLHTLQHSFFKRVVGNVCKGAHLLIVHISLVLCCSGSSCKLNRGLVGKQASAGGDGPCARYLQGADHCRLGQDHIPCSGRAVQKQWQAGFHTAKGNQQAQARPA